MSKKIPQTDLMLFADGELTGTAAEEIGAAVSENTVARERVAAVREIGEVLRGHLELETDETLSNARTARMWDGIESGIASPSRGGVAREEAQMGLWESLTRWWDSFHSHVLVGAGVGVATLLLVVAVRPFEREVERTVQAPSRLPVRAVALQGQAPEVENMEIYDGQGMILTVAGEDGEAPTAVIWLQDEEPSVEGPL